MARSRSSLIDRLPLVVCAALVALPLAAWSPAPATPRQQEEAALRIDAPPCFATVTGELPPSAARIRAARDPERVTISTYEVVDIDPDGARLHPGDHLEIFRLLGPVRRPDGGELGEGILVIGTLTVTDVVDGRVAGQIGEICTEVEVGDRVRPVVERDLVASVAKPDFDPGRALAPRAGDATVVFGHVETVPDAEGGLGGRWAQISYSAGEVVTIDQGTADGWSEGMVTLLYQHGPLGADSDDYDEEDVVLLGTGVVLSARVDTSAVLITGGDRAVRIGARARRLQEDGR